MMKNFSILVGLLLISFFGKAQDNQYEIGAELQAISISSQGGTIGGALKFAIVQDEALAFGPSIRYQYIWSKNVFLGTKGNSSTMGAGGFLHYRLLEWFFVGTEIELLRNPYNYMYPEKKWALTAFIGGGISKDFGKVRLNIGLLYDVVDGLSNPATKNPSPLSRDYFLKIQNPENPNMGKYIPLIYRIAFFFPLNKKE